MKYLLIVVAAVLVGCAPIRFTKEYELHRGPNGAVTETVERETTVQHGYTFWNHTNPEHLRYDKENKETVEVHY